MSGQNRFRSLSDSVPELDGREIARVKEVSPCSEYTRFTVEGTLKDPFSGLSVPLGTYYLGSLFRNSFLEATKWSQALGYGLGLIGSETRVHLYKSGKFVIRRADDRTHADRTFLLVARIAHPAIYSTRHGLFAWELLLDHISGVFSMDDDAKTVFSWPYEEGDLLEFRRDHIQQLLRDGYGDVLEGILGSDFSEISSSRTRQEELKGSVWKRYHDLSVDVWTKDHGSLFPVYVAGTGAIALDLSIEIAAGSRPGHFNGSIGEYIKEEGLEDRTCPLGKLIASFG